MYLMLDCYERNYDASIIPATPNAHWKLPEIRALFLMMFQLIIVYGFSEPPLDSNLSLQMNATKIISMNTINASDCLF